MCHITSQQIAADGAAVGQALENLAVALKTVDPTVSASLQTAGQDLISATANWQEGDALSILTDAEQAAIIVLNSIPLTSPYSSLVAIAFAALNLLIANATTQTKQTGNSITDAHMLLATAAVTNTDSHWSGKAVIKHHFLNPPRKDFESAWNNDAEAAGVARITL